MTLAYAKVGAALKNWPRLAALVGGAVYPLAIPQATEKPVIAYEEIASRPASHLAGFRGENARIQVRAFSRDYNLARQIAREIINALIITGTANEYIGGHDDYDPETNCYMASLDFWVWQEEGAAKCQ